MIQDIITTEVEIHEGVSNRKLLLCGMPMVNLPQEFGIQMKYIAQWGNNQTQEATLSVDPTPNMDMTYLHNLKVETCNPTC